jgi:hypothetical protein
VAALRENPFADVPATPSTPKRSYRGVDNERVATRATAVGTDFDSFLGGSGIITFLLFCCSCGIISCFCMWILALTVLLCAPVRNRILNCGFTCFPCL